MTMNEPAFAKTGVDLFGWFFVKRGRTREKRYISLFTCLTTRAVHLEVLHSLDLDSFIECFRRFTCRRGQVSLLQSDNATNFKGADRELSEAIDSWNNSDIGKRLQQRGTTWKYLPARSSHMGGAHERLIRSARSCLRHALNDQVLGDESFSTFVTEVEFMLNSRPLAAFSSSPDDLRPLTPNDLLLPRPGPGLPPDALPDEGPLKRRWRQTQMLVDRFWKRYRSEYLSLMSLRSKWITERRSVSVGDLVLLADGNLPRSQWTMGRVKEVYLGSDDRVRSCLVKTATTQFVRPIVKMCVLEEASEK